MTKRELTIESARQKIGRPYLYGSKGPDAFDCSGLVTTSMRAAGIVIEDINSTALAARYAGFKIPFEKCIPGCLLFYGKPVSHVMMCLERWKDGHFVLVGARGGDAKTTDLDIAYNNNAMVSVVRGNYWFEKLNFVADPFMEEV